MPEVKVEVKITESDKLYLIYMSHSWATPLACCDINL